MTQKPDPRSSNTFPEHGETREAQHAAQHAALERVRRYVAMRQAQPLHAIGDCVHAIQGGTEFEAELTYSDLVLVVGMAEAIRLLDLQAAMDALAALEAVVGHGDDATAPAGATDAGDER